MTSKTLSELAALCGATVEGDGARAVVGPAGLADASDDHVSFLADGRYRAQLESTRAAGVLVEADVDRPETGVTLLRCENPSRAFTEIVRAFAEPHARPPQGVHPTAVVADGVELGAEVCIGPHCVIGEGARLGDGVVLHAGVVVGPQVTIGAATEIHAHAVLYQGTAVGERCLIHAGVVLGADGYGFEPTAEGWKKIPQCGTAEIGDDVELGAGCTIDRGRFGATRVGSGSKLDAQVHLGHNVVLGDAVLLVAQVGIAGSTRLGDRAILGGQVGVNGHIEIGAGARVSGGSLVFRSIPPGEDHTTVMTTAPKRESARASRALWDLPELERRVAELEAELRKLRGKGTS